MKDFISQYARQARERYDAGETSAAGTGSRSGKTGTRRGARSGTTTTQTGKAGRRTAARIAAVLERAANNTDTVDALDSIKAEVRRIDDRSADDLGWR